MAAYTNDDFSWTFNGLRIYVNGGASYSCPALKLYGYATPRAIELAINRALKSASLMGLRKE
jgi:hypothetical protein